MQSAIKLFARKGFSATSVQEIATNAGISKGAFYLHFSSKDELLFALFDYYYNQMKTKVEACAEDETDPRRRFIDQLTVMFEEIASHREFIIMQIREQTIPFNEDIETFTKRMRYESYSFYQNHILSIYGDKAEPISFEASILIEGMYKAFLELILIEGVHVEYRTLAEALLKRIDYIVDGFMHYEDEPVLTKSFMSGIIPEEFLGEQKPSLPELLEEAKKDASSEETETLTILQEEMEMASPRTAIIKGMLAILKDNPEYEEIISRVEETYLLSRNG